MAKVSMDLPNREMLEVGEVICLAVINLLRKVGQFRDRIEVVTIRPLSSPLLQKSPINFQVGVVFLLCPLGYPEKLTTQGNVHCDRESLANNLERTFFQVIQNCVNQEFNRFQNLGEDADNVGKLIKRVQEEPV